MNQAFYKDIWRSIKKDWKRFLSILIITALGVGMVTGFYAACMDLYYSADRFFDGQALFDIRILSTLGLTQEDVDALARVDGVEAVEGGYVETVHTDIGGERKSADMTVLSRGSINMPLLLTGALPANPGEMAVTQKYLDESGKSIGDTVTIQEDLEESGTEDPGKDPPAPASPGTDPESDSDSDLDLDMDTDIGLDEEEETPTFANTSYTITGVVLDPQDIRSNEDLTSTFRATVTADYTFFVTEADVDSDLFTVVYLVLSGTGGMNSYSDEYKDRVQSVVSDIEHRIKAQRERARYDAVLREAQEKIADAKSTMHEKFAEADSKFADAWRDIHEARQELADGVATLIDEQKDAEEQLAEARETLEDAKRELAKAEKKLAEGEDALAEAEEELLAGERELADGRTGLLAGQQELAGGEAQLIAAEAQLGDGEARLAQGEAELNQQAQTLAEGRQQLQQERNEALAQFAGAEQQLREAQEQLDAARLQLNSEIAVLKSTLGDAWPTAQWDALVDAAAALAAAGADDAAIAAGTASQRSALTAAIGGPSADAVVGAAIGLGKLNGGQQALDLQTGSLGEQKAAALQELDEADAQLSAAEAQLEGARAAIAAQKAELAAGKARLAEERATLEAGKAELAAGWAQWNDGRAKLDAGWVKWEDGKAELADGRTQLKEGKLELADGEATLNKEEAEANAKLADAWDEIAEGRQELADGEAELTQKEQEYAEKKEEAQQKLSDAYAELDDLDMTKWYVQDRTSLDSYNSLNSDLTSIEAVGRIFPIIFLLVATLMSLTTMTRMVEEERGLIGTYKALGYGDAHIYRKYILFAFIACVFGGILGDLFGFVLLPKFIAFVLESLYSFPRYYLRFDILYGLGGPALFMAAIIGATVLACRSELVQMPAVLLRPKAPRAGSRVWLERIPAVWNRLKFLSKVTVRNLFRYKKRLLMTIGGIMGCTALIICGFAIKDSVMMLAPNQYDVIYRYDLMAVFEAKEYDEMTRRLADDEAVRDYLSLRIESVKLLSADGESIAAQLMVLPNGRSIEGYVRTENLDGGLSPLGDDGVLITQNAAKILGLKPGGTVLLQNLDLDQGEAAVSGVVKNYLGNNVYMTQARYESLFGAYEPNGVLAHLSESCADPAAYADALLEDDAVISAVSNAALRDAFGFDLLNAVVLLLIVMAGGLAFVVLFTLSNTNISERVRELATIKVLGFYDREVYQYVNKETLILTAMGILAGLPAGRALGGLLTAALNMPALHFAVYIKPVSYLIAAAITFCFTIIVNWMTNRSLDRINMVEALKSVE